MNIDVEMRVSMQFVVDDKYAEELTVEDVKEMAREAVSHNKTVSTGLVLKGINQHIDNANWRNSPRLSVYAYVDADWSSIESDRFNGDEIV